jgi:hypothetical protein
MLQEACGCPELRGRVLHGSQQTDGQTEFRLDHAHRFDQVAVIGKYRGSVVGALEAIKQQMAGQGHIAALLFRFPYSNHVGPRQEISFVEIGLSETRVLPLFEKRTEMDLQLRHRSQRIQ